MSAIFTFDDSLWPLLVIRVIGRMSDKEVEEFLARSISYARRGEKYVGIVDMSQTGLFSPSQRQVMVEWLREHDDTLREQMLGAANIVTSTPIRLALSLVFYLKPLPMPHVAVSDMCSAVRYVTSRLEEGGLASEAERIRHHFGASCIRVG